MKKIIILLRIFLFTVALYIIFFDLTLKSPTSDRAIFKVTSLLFVWNILSQVDFRFNLVFALLLMGSMPLFLIINQVLIADKLAIWSFVFLTITIASSVMQILYKPKKKIHEFLLYANIFHSILFYVLTVFSLLIKSAYKTITRTISLIHRIRNIFLLSVIVTLLITLVITFAFFLITYSFPAISAIAHISSKIGAKVILTFSPILKIEKIEPKIAYRGNKIIIFGYGFGERTEGILKKKQNNLIENIQTDYWNNDKIIFTIPLHWKNGVAHLWIEKKTIKNNKWILIKSNTVNMRLIPSTGSFTNIDQKYFDQLEHLNEETLKINGY